MRLAVFADVHGDLRALEAVLRDAGLRGAEGAVHLGDLVGDGGDAEGVVERIRREGVPGVVGDWDLQACACESSATAPVGEEGRRFLQALPAVFVIEEGGSRFLFAHASPDSPTEPVLDEASDECLAALLKRCGADVLVVGHTHRAFARRVGEGLILNPGSVAPMAEADPRPSYLILDTASGIQALRVRVDSGGSS